MKSEEKDKIIYSKEDLWWAMEKLQIFDSEFEDLCSDFLEKAIYIYNNRKIEPLDAVIEVVDVALKYSYEKWLVIQNYCEPENCNYNYAIDEFKDNLTYALECLIEKQEKRREEE